jgi:hypothetical protein
LYHLQDHPSGIHQKIDTALGDEIVEQDDGLTKVIAFLDTIYKADDLALMWSKYKRFTRLKKVDDQQPITEFVAEFEAAYKEAKDNGCEVSDTVLALSLLDSCNLSDIDEKFVLTDVDFVKGKEEKNCLDQVKRSLRKFQSRDRLAQPDQFHVRKEEDAFIADVKGALIADGWRPPSNSSAGAGASNVKQNSPFYQGKKNKLGSDGKVMTCLKCNSEYHFAPNCDKVVEETPPSTSSKQKKKQNPKGKKKTTNEPTMLPQLLARRS